MPIFSVIIPTYNRQELVAATLDSAFKQRLADFEVIVVDDGSTDGTIDVVAGYGSRVRIVQQQNRGPGAARNAGAREAQGTYLAFLDSDDIWFPWTLEVCAQAIERHGGPCVVSQQRVDFVQESELATVKETAAELSAYEDYLCAADQGIYFGSNMTVVRRETMLSAGGFVEDRINMEDHDFAIRVGTAPGFVRIVSPVTIAWRRHAGSATMDHLNTLRGILRLIEQEKAGRYPGGVARQRQRREIIVRHARSAAVAGLAGHAGESWSVYWQTLGWNVARGRLRFLAGFPLRALEATLKRGA